MELELKQESLDTYESAGEWTLTQEESCETIVPDYCPDIARIIETEGTVCLHSRELQEGKAIVTGTLRITLLYTPEGESSVRALEYAMPFTMEGGAAENAQILLAEVYPEYLDARMLNPRKVFTHCKLVAHCKAYREQKIVWAEDCTADEGAHVETKRETQKIVLLSEIAERDFTFSDVLTLSPGRPGAAEVLKSGVSCVVTESKAVGNKLVFKGTCRLSLLYRSEDGKCFAFTGELPFSQIMEISGAPETSSAAIQIQLSGLDIQLDSASPDGREITVTLYLHAIALLRQEREIRLISDLYSTSYELRYEALPITVVSSWDALRRRQTVREILEIGVTAESILSLSAQCGAVMVSREGNGPVLRTSVLIRALYLDEGGTPLAAERRIEVSCQADYPEGCAITARAECTEELQGSLGERGIEVRFPVDFQIEVESQAKKVCVNAAELDENKGKDSASAPSLILRQICGNETAWDLAKACNTTIAEILSANQLESEQALPKNQLILIPRKRA